ncbi:unnamed protein product [Rhizophagus irregularis]|nr:unnamed protein product [Rhizophagus irregularis]
MHLQQHWSNCKIENDTALLEMKEWFIKHAESHEVIQKYYALNNAIEKRVKEENREIGEQVRERVQEEMESGR